MHTYQRVKRLHYDRLHLEIRAPGDSEDKEKAALFVEYGDGLAIRVLFFHELTMKHKIIKCSCNPN